MLFFLILHRDDIMVRSLMGGKEKRMKQIEICIHPDGKIDAETFGIKGKGCLKYVELLEKMLHAQTVDSDYTSEYYETEEELTQIQETEMKIKR